MTPTERLADWYIRQCDGEWEHSFGITLETLDNPGWRLRIDSAGTDTLLADRKETGADMETGDRWLTYQVEQGVFVAHGAPAMLDRMIDTFFRIGAQ